MVRVELKSILRAQLLSQINGSYWEEQMESSAGYISKLSERERLDFYRSIILTGKLDGSSALSFYEFVVQNDTELLRVHLCFIRDGDQFRQLSAKQQEAITIWADLLKAGPPR